VAGKARRHLEGKSCLKILALRNPYDRHLRVQRRNDDVPGNQNMPRRADLAGGCDLDTEPRWLPHTRAPPDTPTCQELIENQFALATVVKNIDQNPDFRAGYLTGSANVQFQGQDWATLQGQYRFVDLY